MIVADSSNPRNSLARNLKSAWAIFWLAFFGNIIAWRVVGSEVILLGLYVVLACSLWLAFATARAASKAGYAGLLWGIGVVVLGPLGALLLPWVALSKLRSVK